VKLQVVQEELKQIAARGEEKNEDIPPQQLNWKVNSLKTEYSELMGELRRRSSIVDGVYFEVNPFSPCRAGDYLITTECV